MAAKIVYVSPLEMAKTLREHFADNKTIGVRWVKSNGDVANRSICYPNYEPPAGSRSVNWNKEKSIRFRDVTKAGAISDAYKRYLNGQDPTPLQAGILSRQGIKSFDGMTKEQVAKIRTWSQLKYESILSIKAKGVTYKLQENEESN